MIENHPHKCVKAKIMILLKSIRWDATAKVFNFAASLGSDVSNILETFSVKQSTNLKLYQTHQWKNVH